MNNHQDDEPLDPAEMFALLESQKRTVDLAYLKPVALLYLIWGIAWLGGFLLLWLAHVTTWLSLPVAGVTFAVLIAGSIATSAIIGARIGRGVKGTSNFQGIVYGVSWSLSGAAFAALGVGLLKNGMSSELATLYFPAAYALMAGILYLMGAALWNERSQLVLGVLLLAIGAGSVFFGAPTNNLVMAIGGGGGFLAAAAHFALVIRKAR